LPSTNIFVALRNVLHAELDKNYGVEYIGGLATKEFCKNHKSNSNEVVISKP